MSIQPLATLSKSLGVRVNSAYVSCLDAPMHNETVMNLLLAFPVNLHWCIHEVNEPIQGMGHRTFQRIFNRDNSIINLSALHGVKHVFNGRCMDIFAPLPEPLLRGGVGVGVLRTKVRNCQH